ncbi:MAG: TAT-variant-translocated molybdopterin oxidoreductase [Phycisphaerales bacterium]|nr:TAT-variant-translocated molybdopterin oxidoreductase [Phycisphaerales bacterium]
MSQIDQCPSSKKEGLPAERPVGAREISRATGKAYWKSLDDLAQSREFTDFVQREFPAFASELLEGSRRTFLKIMGASLALAGAATLPGCRRPDHKILAYNRDPEDVVQGKPLFYATAMPLPGGGCEGLLAETYEGRPTKIEGNPLHPVNRGKSSIWSQASVLDLYDPDRDPKVMYGAVEEGGLGLKRLSFEQFQKEAAALFPGYDGSGGKGLAFLVEKATSPARDLLKAKILARWKNAGWFVWDPCDDESGLDGSRLAFGSAFDERYSFEKARVVLSLDADFLGDPAAIAETRGFSGGRYMAGAAPRKAAESRMSRVYSIGPVMTLTAGQADHKAFLKPSAMPAAVLAIASALLGARSLARPDLAGLKSAVEKALAAAGGVPAGLDARLVAAIVGDLSAQENTGKSVIVAGPSLPAPIRALVMALNIALGNSAPGGTVRYVPVRGDAAASSSADVKALAEALGRGEVKTLVIVGGNPAYDAPADLELSAKLRDAKGIQVIFVGQANETASVATHFLPRALPLETWGDVTDGEDSYSVVQPMIKPLWGDKSDLEVLSAVLGDARPDGFELVREAFSAFAGVNKTVDNQTLPSFEKAWRRVLHDGVLVKPMSEAAKAPKLNTGAVQAAVEKMVAARAEGVEVVFRPSPKVHDGRFANNGWLQELPHPITKVTWDNPVQVSRRTAERLGLNTSRKIKGQLYNRVQVAEISLGGRKVRAPILVQPGMADDVIVVELGYGRKVVGRVGEGAGFDGYAIRPLAGLRTASGATVTAADDPPYLLATVQDHWTMEGRGFLREIDLPAWQKFGDADISKDKSIQLDNYGRDRGLNFAGRLGLEGHAPANVNPFMPGQEKYYVQVDERGDVKRDARGRPLGKVWVNPNGPQPAKPRRIQQWGMAIDMTKCTGCGACMVACQAENNVPIVGKMEVAKGREMHWIRVDRYYASSTEEDAKGFDAFSDEAPDMLMQPVTCLHCENAPCEVVCPVNATVHDEEGTNNMAYNRCIGTRYCSNNCPYKVRRFNWFDYATKQFKGGYGQLGEPLAGKAPLPSNQNFIPPRLRAKKADVLTLQSNPHVTVRSRGVMEKCTYCIQRINSARVETKLADLSIIPDGYVQTACQQACPAEAIAFGDIYDYDANDGAGSLVHQWHSDGRSYGMLAYLNTRPRTTHLLRLRNPHPDLVSASRKQRWEEPFGHHGGDHPPGGSHGGGEHGKSEGHVMSLPILSAANGGLA